jgi:hypothetical protein
MTVLSILDVQTSIAAGASAVSGLKTCYTSANAPIEVFTRDCPCMLPDPFKTIESSNDEPKSWGGVGYQRTRTFNFAVLICEAGAGRRPSEAGSTLSSMWDGIENYLCDWDMAGTISTGPLTLAGGQVQDATGKPFVGFTAALTVVSQY